MAADTIGEFGSDYLRLGLRIDKHQDGYKDYYYGPPEIKEQVDKEEKIHPKQLHKDCSSLQKEVFDQGFDKKREIRLEKMLKAMEVTIETDLLNLLENRSFEEDFKLLTDLEIRPYKESRLNEFRAQIDEAYGGVGPLSERMAQFRKKRSVPGNKALQAFRRGLDIAEQRTREVFPDMFPKGQKIDLEKDSGSGSMLWSFYNWYQGNFTSLVTINPTWGAYWTIFLKSGVHEGYPGHHTTFVVAEDKLYRKKNYFEYAILLYKTPYMVMCEGMADIAIKTLFSCREQAEIALKEFFPFCVNTKNAPSIEELLLQDAVRKNYTMINFNAAYHKHVDKWSDKEVIKYLKTFGAYEKKITGNIITRFKNPVYRTTEFAHQIGRELITDALGENPSPKEFRHLLENPVLPSDLT